MKTTAAQLIEQVADGADARKILLKEGYGSYIIKPSALDDKILKELEAADAEIGVSGVDDEIPVPFDADIQIKGSNLSLDGSVDTGGLGSCVVEISKSKADSYYNIHIGGGDDVKEILDNHNIKSK